MARVEQKSAKVTSFDEDRVRRGKTRRDHLSGAWARRMQNQDARALWLKDGGAYPTHTCNGHRYYRGGSDTRHLRRQQSA